MQQLKPTRGREQDARVRTASWGWHRFFEEHLGNLTGLLKGHGESKWTKLTGEEAQHSWVFVRRDALDSEDPENIAGLVINNAWGDRCSSRRRHLVDAALHLRSSNPLRRGVLAGGDVGLA